MLSPGFNQYRFAQNVILIIFKKNPLRLSDGVLPLLSKLQKQWGLDSEVVYKLFEKLDEKMKAYLGGYFGLNHILLNYGSQRNFLQSLILLERLMLGICSGIATVDLVTSLEKVAGADNSDLFSIEKIMAWNYLSDPISKELEENLDFALSTLCFTFFMQSNLIANEELKIYEKKYFYLNKLKKQETLLYKEQKNNFIKKLANYPILARFADATDYVDLVGLQKKIGDHLEQRVLLLEDYYDISECLYKLTEMQLALSNEYQVWKNIYEQALQIERNRFIQLVPLFLGIGSINSENFLRLLKDTLNYPSYGMLISSPIHVVSLIKSREGFFFQDPNGLQCKADFYSESALNQVFAAIVWSLYNDKDYHGNSVALYIKAFCLNLPNANLTLNKRKFDTSSYFLSEKKLNQYQCSLLKAEFQHLLNHDPLLMLQNYKYLAKKYPLILPEAFKASAANIAYFFNREQITQIYFQSVLVTLFPSSRRSVPSEFKEIQLAISNIVFNLSTESQQKLKQVFLAILKKYADSHPLEYLEYYNLYYSVYKTVSTAVIGREVTTQRTDEPPQKMARLAVSINSPYSFFKPTEVSDEAPCTYLSAKVRVFN
ncbi:MAG: hypothetical protein V4471_02895 [Pseudomonadota bacterium]